MSKTEYVWREVFRVAFHDRSVGEQGCLDFTSFEEAVRAIRNVFPDVDFAPEWSEMPPALNGDRCSDLPFGSEKRGTPLGNLLHLRLKRSASRRKS